jgi:putative ABC transport system ATP-binding protein
VVTHATEVADRARRQITLHDGRIIKDAAASDKNLLPNGIVLDSSR